MDNMRPMCEGYDEPVWVMTQPPTAVAAQARQTRCWSRCAFSSCCANSGRQAAQLAMVQPQGKLAAKIALQLQAAAQWCKLAALTSLWARCCQHCHGSI